MGGTAFSSIFAPFLPWFIWFPKFLLLQPLLETLDTVRRLQRELYRKAKREPKFRFYAWYDKIHRPDVLEKAYALVKESQGNPGIDSISFSMMEKTLKNLSFGRSG